MFIKKISAAVLCAAIIVSANVPAYADNGIGLISSETFGTSSAIEWNGKTELESGKKYTVSKDITLTGNVTIPSKTTVTVKKDAEITVGRSAKLVINGSLVLNRDSELTVSGSLTLNKGKNLVCSGDIKFGKYSAIVINGKLTVKSSGEISGTPKSIKVGKNAAVKITGDNDCYKLAAILSGNDKELDELESFLVETGTLAFADGDIDAAVSSLLPEKMYDEGVAAYNQMAADNSGALTYEEMLDYYGKILLMSIKLELGGKVEKVEIKDFSAEFVPVKNLDDAGIFKEYYGKIENAAKVSGEFELSSGKKTYTTEDFDDVLFVKSDGKWHFYITEDDLAELEDLDQFELPSGSVIDDDDDDNDDDDND